MKKSKDTMRITIRRHCCALSLVLTLLCGFVIIGCKKSPSQSLGASASDLKQQSPFETRPATKVLLIHSYHTGYPWVDAITRGVRMVLSDANVDLQMYYMDTKRRTSKQWKTAAGEKACDLIKEWQPAIVIGADDNAQQYCLKKYAGQASPQIVFCGVNADLEKYGYPASNVTGVQEKPHVEKSLNMFRKLKPDARRIAIVTDDSPTSDGGLKFLKSPPEPFEIVTIKTPSTFDAWKKAIEDVRPLADGIATYMYHTVKSDASDHSESVEPETIMAWTVDHCGLPIIGFFIFTVDDGGLVGYLESGVEHGMEAAKMVKQIMAGITAGDIPVKTALQGQSMLNLITARKLGIEVPDEMIKNTEIIVGK
jgi:ABC-type uncharacterized transport system substrate-binding protein